MNTNQTGINSFEGLDLKVVAWLIVTFMGLSIFLAGIILFFQERVVPLIYGGYMVERPYWQIGLLLMVFGIVIIIAALTGIIFIPIEKKIKEWTEK